MLIVLNQSRIEFERVKLLSSFSSLYRLVLRQFDSLYYLFNIELIRSLSLYEFSLSLINLDTSLSSIQLHPFNSVHSVGIQASVSIRFIESKQLRISPMQLEIFMLH